MSLKKLLSSLINASEKASNIARVCRANSELFSLLVEEKKESERNPRFFQDFKTLADVLIQETIKNDVGKDFPELKEFIKGEETNKFTNTLGTTIILEVNEDLEATENLLEKVLDDNRSAAQVLAAEVHKSINVSADMDLPELTDTLELKNYGVWIDPIDGTSEYIKGGNQDSHNQKIPKSGLKCATVLIGVYNRISKCPVIGILNQPFYKEISGSYESRIYWGVSLNGKNFSNIPQTENSDKVCVISGSENQNYQNLLKSIGYDLVCSSGAGHKILQVILGNADIYFLSSSTTYKWDTCSGQAILNSLNGGVLDFQKTLSSGQPVILNYDDDCGKCNNGGLIAYRNSESLQELLIKLRENNEV